MELSFTAPDKYLDQASQFHKTYVLENAIFPLESNKREANNNKKGVCKFCGRSKPDVKFKKDAHTFPELLGNKNLFSSDECDKCNQFFGDSYENDLTNFLGIHRAIHQIKGKKKIPKFKSSDNKIIAEQELLFGSTVAAISRFDSENDSIVTDRQNGKITITFKKNPYSPVNVYKCLLKMALSILDFKEVRKNYSKALKLLSEKGNSLRLNPCFVSGFYLPLNYNLPVHALLFKKRDEKAKVFTHVVAFYFLNFIISIPIPLNEEDLFFYLTEEVIVPIYPPYFTQLTKIDGESIMPFSGNFSSEQKVIGEEETIIIEGDPEEFRNAVPIDPLTGNILEKTQEPSETMKILIMKPNRSSDP